MENLVSYCEIIKETGWPYGTWNEYRKRGFIPPPVRLTKNPKGGVHGLYPAEALTRARMIVQLRKKKRSLKEIGEILKSKEVNHVTE